MFPSNFVKYFLIIALGKSQILEQGVNPGVSVNSWQILSNSCILEVSKIIHKRVNLDAIAKNLKWTRKNWCQEV